MISKRVELSEGLCTWSRRRGLYVIMNLKEGEWYLLCWMKEGWAFASPPFCFLLSSIYPSKGILTSLVTKLFHFSLFLSNKRCIFVVEKIAALIGSGNSSIFMKYRDKLRFSMAGHALRGNLWVGGLQRGRALKPCHSEFHHIIGAAFYKKGMCPITGHIPFLLISMFRMSKV